MSLTGGIGILVDAVLAARTGPADTFFIGCAALFPVATILGLISVKRIRAGRGKLGGRGIAVAALIIGAVGSVLEITFVVFIAVITGGFQHD